MAKAATVKDVLYALEFTGARLCMQPATAPGRPVSWVIQPGGVRVPARIADEARAHPGITAVGVFGEAVYAWRQVA